MFYLFCLCWGFVFVDLLVLFWFVLISILFCWVMVGWFNCLFVVFSCWFWVDGFIVVGYWLWVNSIDWIITPLFLCLLLELCCLRKVGIVMYGGVGRVAWLFVFALLDYFDWMWFACVGWTCGCFAACFYLLFMLALFFVLVCLLCVCVAVDCATCLGLGCLLLLVLLVLIIGGFAAWFCMVGWFDCLFCLFVFCWVFKWCLGWFFVCHLILLMAVCLRLLFCCFYDWLLIVLLRFGLFVVLWFTLF